MTSHIADKFRAVLQWVQMLDPSQWPEWLHVVRLVSAVLLTAALGVHAYGSHVRETAAAVSSRRWVYWLYSAVFLAATVANFTQLYVTLVFRSYTEASFHLGYGTLLLALSYVALLAGVRRKPC